MIYIFAIILIIGVGIKTTDKIIEHYEIFDETDYDAENFPYTHWVMMGLKDFGQYELSERKFTSSFDTKEEKRKQIYV